MKPTADSNVLQYSFKMDATVVLDGSYDVSGAYSSGPLYFYASTPFQYSQEVTFFFDAGTSFLVKNLIYTVN